MKEGATLCALKINYGQSEVWLGKDGKELTQRRRLATNEVVNVVRRHCPHDVFRVFYADFSLAAGSVATLTVANLDEIAAELRLEA